MRGETAFTVYAWARFCYEVVTTLVIKNYVTPQLRRVPSARHCNFQPSGTRIRGRAIFASGILRGQMYRNYAKLLNKMRIMLLVLVEEWCT
ncbi:unnamed protein product [Peronospora belbahrii]|uniref:Secreted protein n=1 Tax=Peronospora belbahrii TaxID=622444 RepID=A0AAU9KKZ1_9STRA|nr:unnamed protein product [Peronospora belbahrii]CAH0520625.1 unnamed protein product [Peronospora belbahrii]